MKKPSYEELANAYRDLFISAQIVSDGFENHKDHYKWKLGMNPVEDLREELEKGRWESNLQFIIYQDEE